jgi:hypothetical protein
MYGVHEEQHSHELRQQVGLQALSLIQNQGSQQHSAKQQQLNG